MLNKSFAKPKAQVKTILFSGTLILVKPKADEHALKTFNNAIAQISYDVKFGTVYKINGRTYRQF